MGDRDRATDSGHHLTTQPEPARPRTPQWKSRNRPASQPRPHHNPPTTTPESPITNQRRWIRAQEKTTEYRDAIFRVMSIVQAAGTIVNRYVKLKYTATPEAVLVYSHLNIIMPDLRNALTNWGPEFDLWDSAKNTNMTLDALKPVKNGFAITQATVSDIRLPESTAQVLPPPTTDTPDTPPTPSR